MKDLFIPFKESQEMKELGFDEPCLATYHKELHTIIPIYAEYTNQDVNKAPTFSQAFKWFRDNHKLHSGIYPYYDEYEDYLETLPENINISGQKGLFGKELKILEPYFESIEELKGKKIEIIEELKTIGETPVSSL